MMNNSTRITADDLQIEILKRIPAKTLTRFRCVSKHWNHLIRRPDFAATHYNHTKTLPAAAAPTVVLLSFSHRMKRIFYTINDEGQAHHHLTIDTEQFGFITEQSGFKNLGASEFINGILCLFDIYPRKALVCNIATGEIVRLPDSSLDLESWYTPRYSLGFDPENNQYKVLCVWTRNRRYSWTAEVFTVGISKEWRNIEPCNNFEYFHSQSVCVNGIMYWEIKFDDDLVKSGFGSFNVKDEKFQITHLPPNIWGGLIGHRAQFMQFKGHLAIVNRNKSKLLMLGNDGEIRIHGFKKRFRFPSEDRYLIITRNLEKFIVLEQSSCYREPKLIHYEIDGKRLTSIRITRLKEAMNDYPCWSHAINEHVENIYPLARS